MLTGAHFDLETDTSGCLYFRTCAAGAATTAKQVRSEINLLYQPTARLLIERVGPHAYRALNTGGLPRVLIAGASDRPNFLCKSPSSRQSAALQLSGAI